MTIQCSHGRAAPDTLQNKIHHNQGGAARHRCVICAYAAGLEGRALPVHSSTETCDAGSQAPVAFLSELHESQAGVGRHGCAVCAYAFGKKRRSEEAAIVRESLPNEMLSVVGVEGAPSTAAVTVYERDPALRAACIDHYGASCQVCGLEFEERYGELGRGFIHVHHLRPLSAVGEGHQVDAISGLLPVCPNCHAMIHRGRPPSEPRAPAELRSLLASGSRRTG